MSPSVRGRLLGRLRGPSRLKALDALFEQGLPPELRDALQFLASRDADAAAEAVAQRAEARRSEIAAEGDREVPIWYSPKPGSAGDDASEEARPEPGEELAFTMEQVAHTGKNQKWGTVLYLLTRGFGSTQAIELGACAGISAMYFASAPSMQNLITVEGSAALSGIATRSLQSLDNARVVNARFDDAIDKELPALEQKLDLAYIDGHHEKVATIHYFNRMLPFLAPGAVVIFDDVSWSQDMRDGWNELRVRAEFAHAVDLGAIGVCVMKSEDDQGPPRTWELQPILGAHGIGTPHGWAERGVPQSLGEALSRTRSALRKRIKRLTR